MTMVGAVAAWYPDPADPAKLRWWDGNQWTPHSAPAGGGQTAHGRIAHSPSLAGLNLSAAPAHGRNHFSLVTFAVGALYLALSFATHFVLIGFIPLAMAMRAKRAREPLAPLAIASAVGVIAVSLITLFY